MSNLQTLEEIANELETVFDRNPSVQPEHTATAGKKE